MSAATVLTSSMPGMPALSGTGGSLAALFRHIAPVLGWSIEFDNGIDIIVIRPQSYGGGQALYYRIDDGADRGGSAPRVAGVGAYESMSDINTGAGLIGTTYIHKSYYASTAAQKYFIIGDQYGLWFCGNAYRTFAYDSGACCLHFMGFLNRYLSTDTPLCGLCGHLDAALNSTTSAMWLVAQACTTAATRGCFIHKNRSGTTGIACTAIAASSHQIAGRAFGSNESAYRFATSYAGSFFYSATYLNDGAANTAGALFPGLYIQHHDYSATGIQDVGAAPATITASEIDGKSFVRASSYTTSSGTQFDAAGLIFDIGGGFRP